MATDAQNPAPAPPPPAAATGASHGVEPHLFDRISVLYKYRWASITVFLLVVGWVMIDSYTQVPRYRATARILVEEPGNDVATPTEIARTAPLSDPEMYMQTQLRIIRGLDLALRVS